MNGARSATDRAVNESTGTPQSSEARLGFYLISTLWDSGIVLPHLCPPLFLRRIHHHNTPHSFLLPAQEDAG